MSEVTGVGRVSVEVDFEKDSIELILFLVQFARRDNMELLLKNEMRKIDSTNKGVANLNKVQTALGAVYDKFAVDAPSSTKVSTLQNAPEICDDIRDAAEEAGIPELFSGLAAAERGFGGSVDKGQIATKREEFQNEVDRLTNSLSLQMIKTQALHNRLNEATELMSKFIKTDNDTKSSIIRNF